MNNKIKVGICVSYDWILLKNSIPKIYKEADIICLGLDKDRQAWSGKPFEFDNDSFFNFVSAIDVDNKIIIYEDDFSLSELDTRKNCNRQRKLISEKLGHGGWHLQIDADEYFLDFKGFVDYLKSININQAPINICCPFIPFIKKTEKGYLYVDFEDRDPEIIPIATNVPDYQRARQNGHFNHYTPFHIIHETWSRSETELWYKINNWGHASEELSLIQRRISYFKLWKSLDENNFEYIHNFHPATAETWPKLKFLTAKNIDDAINNIPSPNFPYSKFQLFLKNNKNYSRLKSLKNKLWE